MANHRNYSEQKFPFYGYKLKFIILWRITQFFLLIYSDLDSQSNEINQMENGERKKKQKNFRFAFQLSQTLFWDAMRTWILIKNKFPLCFLLIILFSWWLKNFLSFCSRFSENHFNFGKNKQCLFNIQYFCQDLTYFFSNLFLVIFKKKNSSS